MGKREVELAISSPLKAIPWACSACPKGEKVGKLQSREKGIGNGCPHSLRLWLWGTEGVEEEREAWYMAFSLASSTPIRPSCTG